MNVGDMQYCVNAVCCQCHFPISVVMLDFAVDVNVSLVVLFL